MRPALLFAILAAGCGGTTPTTTVPAPPTSAVDTPPVDGAQPPPVAVSTRPTKVRTVEGITEYRLPNGLQVLLFPDPTQSTVTVNITYLVGSRLEGYGESGMAHLLEHMMFKGTAKHRNVMKLLEGKGAQMNGTTWTDRTNYFETLAATPENLAYALEIEADRMVNATILPEDLQTEFSVVRNEFEMNENVPSRILEERIVSTAYLWHNYGKSTIGSRSDIELVPVPALRAFYTKYYQPDNAILVVAGKFDEAGALAKIESQFGAIPRPTRTLQPSYTVEPVQDGERSVTMRRNGDVAVVGLAYHTVGAASPDYPAVTAALDLLTREPSGRLYQKLVVSKLASSISGDQYMFRDPYLAQLEAEVPDPKQLDKVAAIMTREVEALGTSKIADKEVERWRVATLKDLELAFADSQQLAVELSEFAALGDWRTLFAHRAAVEKVTAADVTRVAKAYFRTSNRTLGKFIPTKDADRAPLTESPDVAAIVKDIESGEVKEPGEPFAATLDNIEARTTRSTLPSGIKAAVLPKKTRGGKVGLRLQLHWGDEKTLQHKAMVAELTAALLQRGTTKRDYQTLRDDENLLKARIWIGGGAQGFTLGIETVRDKLPQAIDLAAEMLRSPTFPAKELELIKAEWRASLEEQRQDPSAVAWLTLQQLSTQWPKADPRYPMSPDEQIAAMAKVSVADIKAFYRDFVGANHAELGVLGDFDPAAITAQIDKRFGGWASKQPYTKLHEKAFDVAGTTKSVAIKDKEMTQLVFAHDLAMKDLDPDYPAFSLAGQVLGGDTGSRIWMRVREAEGLSYGAGTYTSAGIDDDVGTFGGYAIVAPQNLAKAKASMLDEITKLLTGTVTEQELQRAKDAWIKSEDTNLSNDEWIVSVLANQQFYGRTFQVRKDLRAKIAAVTVADIARVAKKYLRPDKLIIVDAGDSTKVVQPAPKPTN